MFNPTRPGRFAPLWAVVVLVATVLSLAVNLGPAVAALVVPTAPTTAVAGAPASVAAPVATVAAVGPVGRCEEDQPCWDCATMGNRLCGYGTAGGPSGSIDGGILTVTCPTGSIAVDLPWVPLGPTTDLPTILRSVGCAHLNTR